MATPDVEVRQPSQPTYRYGSRGIRTRRPKKRPPKAVHCPECNKNVTVEEIDGATVCSECGITINESNIVSEVQFGENAQGAAVVQGAIVGENQRHAHGDGGRYAHVREPREVSEANGREELRKQANWHHLPEHIFDQGFALYKLALNFNFIQGRTIATVAAVCLYAASRRNPDVHMLLIDFSEGIATNVFKIGQAWNSLKDVLMLKDVEYGGVMEVEDLITRFVRRLEFGNAQQKVAQDALLLLRRMKRDWMVAGRRPNGLIGACIILAARMNNFRRTVREVVYVTKVADITVNKRLEEFKRTEASTMTISEFQEFGQRLKQSQPPAVYEREAREARKRKIAELLGEDGEDEQQPLPNLNDTDALHRAETPRSTTASIDRSRSQTQTITPEPRAASPHSRRDHEGFRIPDARAPAIDPNLKDATKFISQQSQNGTSKPSKITSNTTQHNGRSASAPRSPSVDRAEAPGSETSSPSRRVGYPKGRKRCLAAPKWTTADLISEDELEAEMRLILEEPREVMRAEDSLVTISPEGETRSQTLAESLRRATTLEPATTISDDPEISAHEFEDDPEVANCLLSADEQRIKEKIWVTHNEDWLRSQQAKMLKRSLDEAQGKPSQTDPNRKKRKRSTWRTGDGSLLRGQSVESAADAARLMLERHAKNPSKHLNYANMDRIFRSPGSRSSSSAPGSRAGSMAVGSRSGSLARSERGASRESAIEVGDEDDGVGAGATPDRPTDVGANGLITPGQTQQTPASQARGTGRGPATPINRRAGAGRDDEQATPGATETVVLDDDDEEEEDGAPEQPWQEGEDEDEDLDEDIDDAAHEAGIDMGDGDVVYQSEGSDVGFSESEAGDD